MAYRYQCRTVMLPISFIILAAFVSSASGIEPGTDESFRWPEFLQGNVVTVDDKPIADAEVVLTLQKIHEYDSGRWDEVVYSTQIQTDEKGVFFVSTSDLPVVTHRPLLVNIDVTVDGFADARKWFWYGPGKSPDPKQKHMATIKLVPGRLVVGRCVDPSGAPVVGAVVKTASGHSFGKPRVDVRWNPVATDKAGRFYLRVPDDGKVVINSWISHPDWAPQLVEVPLDRNLFKEDIELKKGGVLNGTVRTVDGKPAVGIVVAASSREGGTIDFLGFHINNAVKTDENGQFQLPGLEGDFRVFLTQAGRNDNELGKEFVVSDQAPPMVVPQLVSLAAGENQVLDFIEQPKLTISGRVSWKNGDPVAGHDVQPYYMPTDFRTGIWLIKTVTDDDGNYSIEIPKDMPELGIQVLQARDASGKWHWAHPAEHVDAARKQTQMTSIEIHGEDRANIDWIMQEEY